MFGAILLFVTSIFLEPMLFLFGATNLIIPFAQPYTRIICIGIPFGIFSTAMSLFYLHQWKPKLFQLRFAGRSNFRYFFDPVFLFVFDMGIVGVALATILGQVLLTLLALHYLIKKLKFVSTSARNVTIRFSVTRLTFSL